METAMQLMIFQCRKASSEKLFHNIQRNYFLNLHHSTILPNFLSLPDRNIFSIFIFNYISIDLPVSIQ
jgi:hypothetical protein